MLVLTRKSNESVAIGDDVEVVLLSVCGQHVKLGIVADKSKHIRRSEVSELPVSGLSDAIRNCAARNSRIAKS